jgi:sulfopyruvate decarboxylase alpha subunit
VIGHDDRTDATLAEPRVSWADAALGELRSADVGLAAYVPDAGLTRLIGLCRQADGPRLVALTSEQEGVGVATGAWLGGVRSVLLMQSSGIGNIVNALGMAMTCRVPLLMIVTMRGEWGEQNPWQIPMGQACTPVLAAMGVRVLRLDAAIDAAATVAAAAGLAFVGGQAVAVLVGQRLLGTKSFHR